MGNKGSTEAPSLVFVEFNYTSILLDSERNLPNENIWLLDHKPVHAG